MSSSKVVPYEILLKKQILAEGRREALRVFQLTAGFVDPAPPTDEQVKMMVTGLIEL